MDNKPYLYFGDYLRHKYNHRVFKISINPKFSCPNRDGTLDNKGCLFCGDDGSASVVSQRPENVLEQLKLVKNCFKRIDPATKYISYLQAFSNTYAPINELKKIYDAVIKPDNIIGLMIATRPDLLSDQVLDLIASYQQQGFELWLEIGIQTVHNKSLYFLNRQHDFEVVEKSIKKAKARGISVCGHLILGIPGESWSEMMQTAEKISDLPLQGVKIHNLHVISGTRLVDLYKKGEIKLLELDEYISLLCDFMERLRPDIIIHRLVGERDRKSLIAPIWKERKGTITKYIKNEFIRRGTFQGFLMQKYD
jgi:hypothetical protein